MHGARVALGVLC